MATGVTTSPADTGGRDLSETIRVLVPERKFRQDLRAAGIVWRRELIRFRSDRLRAITGLIQPVLFLFVLGTGLSSLARHGLPSGVDFKTFIYPGVLAMSVLFTAIFSAASIVWDREFGFLREMLVAPVSRAALVIGKCLGGATVATFQGIVILILAGLAHVPYNPVLILTLIGELLLLSFTLTAFGVMMAARITQIQAFMALTQMLVLPLFFLSGALYPLNGPAGLAGRGDQVRPADLHRGSDAAGGVQPPERQPARPARAGSRRHLGRLGRPGVAVAGHRRDHGAHHADHSHCRVPADGVIPAGATGSRPCGRSSVRPPPRRAAARTASQPEVSDCLAGLDEAGTDRAPPESAKGSPGALARTATGKR